MARASVAGVLGKENTVRPQPPKDFQPQPLLGL